jgi:hypothetical protein
MVNFSSRVNSLERDLKHLTQSTFNIVHSIVKSQPQLKSIVHSIASQNPQDSIEPSTLLNEHSSKSHGGAFTEDLKTPSRNPILESGIPTTLALNFSRPGGTNRTGQAENAKIRKPSRRKMPHKGNVAQTSCATLLVFGPSEQKSSPSRLNDPSKVCASCSRIGHVSRDCFQKHPHLAPPGI